MAYKIKRRCNRCLTVLRDDGTCPNKECAKYVLEAEQKKNENAKGTIGKVINKYNNTSDPERSSDTE